MPPKKKAPPPPPPPPPPPKDRIELDVESEFCNLVEQADNLLEEATEDIVTDVPPVLRDLASTLRNTRADLRHQGSDIPEMFGGPYVVEDLEHAIAALSEGRDVSVSIDFRKGLRDEVADVAKAAAFDAIEKAAERWTHASEEKTQFLYNRLEDASKHRRELDDLLFAQGIADDAIRMQVRQLLDRLAEDINEAVGAVVDAGETYSTDFDFRVLG